ncbi:conserved hypothetical protein [Carnobacterium maltaromaticum]|uniref:XcbB/CpsF family capsular polysaccharide biosynthesis protein n=1 Tax=Carnobacterium maltaromaticum TaxID=2751 RepID=UPI00191BC1E3|nr:XcbB/CpsF family capsular polysaccharide biosynthesis protein [Carnobacterium maltaromaticum]CAD5901919.1 conserved hypothetical protein [Carnobacterium maltaromaticum]
MSYNFSISHTNIIDFNPDYSKDKVIVKTFQNDNLLVLAQKFQNTYRMYKDLLKNDYILYFHDKEQSFFCKRTLFEHLWQRKDLIKEGSLFYTLEHPTANKVTTLQEKKLLVIFSCMPPTEQHYTQSAADRCFPSFFPLISKNLVKDITIMRIMDLNLSHGSYYISTSNYPEMEKDVQNAIKKVALSNSVNSEDIVLYGVSKGGSGALYHGSLNDYKVLSVDPIISSEKYNEKDDYHFLVDARKIDLTNDINENLGKCSKRKYIICNENVEFNYKKIKELDSSKVRVLSIKDDTVNYHHEVSKNTVPEQLAILNGFFSENFSIE